MMTVFCEDDICKSQRSKWQSNFCHDLPQPSDNIFNDVFDKIIARILLNFILIAIFLFQAEKYDSCIVQFKTHWFKETDIGGKTVWVGNY